MNYAPYTAAIAAAALIAIDPPHPADLAPRANGVLYTAAGVAIGLLVMLVANQLQKRRSPAPTPPPSTPLSERT